MPKAALRSERGRRQAIKTKILSRTTEGIDRKAEKTRSKIANTALIEAMANGNKMVRAAWTRISPEMIITKVKRLSVKYA